VQKVALPCKDHAYTVAIGTINGFLISQASPWLNDGRNACLCR
jgi:hypothetical protein